MKVCIDTRYVIKYLFGLDNPDIRNRPSEYLRERCPLCFGGVNWQQPEEM
jgi:hypothetical protein